MREAVNLKARCSRCKDFFNITTIKALGQKMKRHVDRKHPRAKRSSIHFQIWCALCDKPNADCRCEE